MKKKLLFVAVFITAIFASNVRAQTVATFDDLSLPTDSFWNGADQSGGFNNGKAFFYNSFDTTYQSWSGFAYSSKTDSLTPGYLNMYSAANGVGHNNSANYAVAYVTSYGSATTLSLSAEARGKIIDGFYINNSTYTYQSMNNGDAYSKKFTSHDSDWFMLRTYGYLNGSKTDSVDFFLADFRFADSSKAYIIKSWTWLDLSTLGNIDSLTFAMSSSDNGLWGMNTPSYFCMDNFTSLDGVGFAENTKQSDIRLYPNPVQYNLHIKLGDAMANEIAIFDASGRLVYQSREMMQGQNIDVSQFKKGFYSIQIITDHGVISRSFIKN